eukprot:scaffold8191_cov67-Phaeocystis_antarctica.AAC.6
MPAARGHSLLLREQLLRQGAQLQVVPRRHLPQLFEQLPLRLQLYGQLALQLLGDRLDRTQLCLQRRHRRRSRLLISRARTPPDRLAHRAKLLIRPLQPQPMVVGLQADRAHGLLREVRIAARRLSETMGLGGLRVQQVHDALQILGLPAIGGVHVCKPGLQCDEAVLQRRELGLRRHALLPLR